MRDSKQSTMLQYADMLNEIGKDPIGLIDANYVRNKVLMAIGAVLADLTDEVRLLRKTVEGKSDGD